jgi:hypothetical protein
MPWSTRNIGLYRILDYKFSSCDETAGNGKEIWRRYSNPCQEIFILRRLRILYF